MKARIDPKNAFVISDPVSMGLPEGTKRCDCGNGLFTMIDEKTFSCNKCGKELHKVEEVIEACTEPEGEDENGEN